LPRLFEPGKYRDTYRQKLESILARKVQGKPLQKIEQPKQAEVVDIAEALRRSLANLKKPAGSDHQLRTADQSAKRSGTKKAARGTGQK
jgi:DNA end-binding protein Ku